VRLEGLAQVDHELDRVVLAPGWKNHIIYPLSRLLHSEVDLVQILEHLWAVVELRNQLSHVSMIVQRAKERLLHRVEPSIRSVEALAVELD
jgi:hypothetical protein